MITILLGPDGLGKKEHVEEIAEQSRADIVRFGEGEKPAAGELSEQNLFSKPKVFVLEALLKHFLEDAESLRRMKMSGNRIVFMEEKIDKRGSAAKAILKDPEVLVREFFLPHGSQLNAWIAQRVRARGGSMSAAAVETLARKVGRDRAVETKFGGKVVEVKEVFDLWQVQGEIDKLIAYAGGAEITPGDVEALVSEQREVDVLAIVNAIGDGRQELSFRLIEEFLAQQAGSDEKAGVIQLNALLSEQFRNICMVQGFLKEGLSDDAVLGNTGWKSGRLFVIKKLVSRFSDSKVRDFLNKLEHLDAELKTGSVPPQVLLDLILVQLF